MVVLCIVGAATRGNPTSFFFFSSRRRHTRFKCDWSSDVCSSDLFWAVGSGAQRVETKDGNALRGTDPFGALLTGLDGLTDKNRSEERRVGKECRSRWSPYH